MIEATVPNRQQALEIFRVAARDRAVDDLSLGERFSALVGAAMPGPRVSSPVEIDWVPLGETRTLMGWPIEYVDTASDLRGVVFGPPLLERVFRLVEKRRS